MANSTRRTAFHTERIERATSRVERLQAAATYLVSALTHGAHAQQFVDRIGLVVRPPRPSRR